MRKLKPEGQMLLELMTGMEPDLDPKKLHMPSLAEMLGVETDNPLMNWKGIFPERPQSWMKM